MSFIQFKASENRKTVEMYDQYFETNYNKFSDITKENLKEFEEFLCYMIILQAKVGCRSIEIQINTDLENEFPEFFKTFKEELGYYIRFYPLKKEYEQRNFNLIISW